MAKQVIVLETSTSDQGGSITIQAALWFPVASGREKPLPALAASAFANASQAELDALKAGTVLEEVKLFTFPATFTPNQIKAEMVAAYTSRATYLATLPNRMQFYGVFFDGSVWSA